MFTNWLLDSSRYLVDNKNVKAIDLRQTLKSHSRGWVAINKKNKKVIADAKTFALISEKVKGLKDVFLMPASKNYFGFVTSIHA